MNFLNIIDKLQHNSLLICCVIRSRPKYMCSMQHLARVHNHTFSLFFILLFFSPLLRTLSLTRKHFNSMKLNLIGTLWLIYSRQMIYMRALRNSKDDDDDDEYSDLKIFLFSRLSSFDFSVVMMSDNRKEYILEDNFPFYCTLVMHKCEI